MKQNFKIVLVSNFDLDYESDRLALAGLTEEAAVQIAEIINQEPGADTCVTYAKVYPYEYELYKFEP